MKTKVFSLAICTSSTSSAIARRLSMSENKPVVEDVFIFVCTNPAFVTNDHWSQPVTSKARPHHYLHLCAFECLLDILPIESFSRRTDHPLTTRIDSDPDTYLMVDSAYSGCCFGGSPVVTGIASIHSNIVRSVHLEGP